MNLFTTILFNLNVLDLNDLSDQLFTGSVTLSDSEGVRIVGRYTTNSLSELIVLCGATRVASFGLADMEDAADALDQSDENLWENAQRIVWRMANECATAARNNRMAA